MFFLLSPLLLIILKLCIDTTLPRQFNFKYKELKIAIRI